jgi:hypothetical protein
MRMRWVRHVAYIGEKRNVYRRLVGKPVGNRPLGRPKRRREDGKEIGWKAWTGLIWLSVRTSGGLL